MKKLILILFLFMSFFLFSEELRREVTKDENGQPITTVLYGNDKNGMVKRVYYGEGPKYPKVIEYYDESNKDYYERCEDYDIDYSDPKIPEGKGTNGVFYYRKGNPFEYVKDEIKVDGIYTVQKFYYVAGNSKNLQNRLVISLGTEKYVSIQEIYADKNKVKDNVNAKAIFYNENQEVIRVYLQYFLNEEFLIDKDVYYDPPTFSQRDGKPKESFTNYYSNPNGFVRTEMVYLPENNIVANYIYDPKYTKNGFTRLVRFYTGEAITRQVKYFEAELYSGNIFFINQYFNEDGTVKSIQFYDKNEKEVKPDINNKNGQ